MIAYFEFEGGPEAVGVNAFGLWAESLGRTPATTH